MIDSEQYFQANPVTAPFVLEAFKLYDEGSTMTEIKDILNERGVRNAKGQLMTFGSVQQKLANNKKAPARHKAEDDKMLLTFNFKEDAKTITFDDVNDAPSKYGNGSDLDWGTAPTENKSKTCFLLKKPRTAFWASSYF